MLSRKMRYLDLPYKTRTSNSFFLFITVVVIKRCDSTIARKNTGHHRSRSILLDHHCDVKNDKYKPKFPPKNIFSSACDLSLNRILNVYRCQCIIHTLTMSRTSPKNNKYHVLKNLFFRSWQLSLARMRSSLNISWSA